MILAPLFAAGIGDFLEFAIPLVMVGLWVVSQFVTGRKQANAPEQQQRRPRPAPKPQRPVTGDPVEEFLRRAQRPPPLENSPQKAPPQLKRASAQTPPQFRGEPVAVDLAIQEPSEDDFSGNVAGHVESHLDTSRYEQRAEHFADVVDHADEKLEEHLHGVFDHKLGQLKKRASESKGAADSAAALSAAEIAAMLKDPAGMRKAIILSEVLQRPVQRWSSP